MSTVSRKTRRFFSSERGGEVSVEDIQSEFAGQWVAVKDDEVISVGADPEAMCQELDWRGISDYEVLDCPEVPIL